MLYVSAFFLSLCLAVEKVNEPKRKKLGNGLGKIECLKFGIAGERKLDFRFILLYIFSSKFLSVFSVTIWTLVSFSLSLCHARHVFFADIVFILGNFARGFFL